MSYSDANGANLRFMVNKDNGKYTVDEDFIKMLSGFGMDELLLPFETKVMKCYKNMLLESLTLKQ